MKIILGRVINTAHLTIQLPKHHQKRLAEILASIPPTQKRTSVKKWYKEVLGELRSMSIALPGSRTLFSQMQEHALTTKLGHRISLKKGIHQAIADIKWILKDSISSRPNRFPCCHQERRRDITMHLEWVQVVSGFHHCTYLQDAVDLIIVPSSGTLNSPRTSLTA